MNLRFAAGIVAICFSLAIPSLLIAHDVHPVRVPLTFEENHGQADPHARFLTHMGEGTILLTENGPVLSMSDAPSAKSIHLHFLKASNVHPAAEGSTGGFANYYRSHDRRQWLSHIPMFSRVRYAAIYKGIDAIFHGEEARLEYDFEVAPGGDPNDIAFTAEGVESVSIAPDGSLNLVCGGETWSMQAPVAYQLHDGIKKSVEVRYRLAADRSVSFYVGRYDPSTMLVIDPVVTFSNFLPSVLASGVAGVKVDATGNIIVAGESGNQVDIVKLNAAGTSVLYSTHIGTSNTLGAFQSTAKALVLDANGNAYVAGITTAMDFPVTSSNLGQCTTFCNAGFVAKFASNGTLAYSTLLGSGQELPRGLVVDSSGFAYVIGLAADNQLQTVNAFQPNSTSSICTTCGSAFFAKLNTSGTNYVFASYFSGPSAPGGRSDGIAVALDGSGNIFLAGETSMDPPLLNPWQFGAGGLFLSKFAPDGKTLLFSTRFGSSQGLSEVTPAGDALTGIAIGSDGTVYLAGYTQSQDFPYTINPSGPQIVPSGYGDSLEMFAMAIDPALTKLTYSVHLGEGSTLCMALSPSGNLYVGGTSVVSLMPLKNPIVSDISTGGFFLELDRSGMPVTVSQFGGSFLQASPSAIAVDSSGDIYLAGNGTPSFGNPYPTTDFGFPSPADPILVGAGLGSQTGTTIAKISPNNAPQVSLSRVTPFLTLHNVGSADLHIASIALGGGLSKPWGNCGSTVPSGTSCILTVSDNGGAIAAGTVTIVSDAAPSTQSFSVAPPAFVTGQPIGDQLWAPGIPIYFPPQPQGTPTATVPVTLWNVGVASATLNSIRALGALSETDNCGVQTTSPATLAPGANCVLQLTLTPGPQQPQLLLTYDTNKFENQSSFYSFVPGSGIPQNQLLLSANSLNFGTQYTGGVAIPRLVTATNTGNSILSAPWVSVQMDPEFMIPANTCTSDLAPRQNCEIAVQFIPTYNGTRTGTLNISGQQVALLGQGLINSVIQVSPLELDFNSVLVSKSYAGTFTLTNTSTVPVAISGVSVSGADFSESDTCMGSIAAGGACAMQITYSPQQPGAEDGSVTITFSNGAATQIVLLSGTAVFPMDVTPSSIDFGSILVGTATSEQGVGLVNGRSPLPQPYSLSITGDFAITDNNCPNVVPGFTRCGFGIIFQPKSIGNQQGSLTVSFPGVSQQSIVTLNGNGFTGPNISLPSTLNFSNRALGSTIQQSLTVSNTGIAAVTISGLSLIGANQSDFQVAPGQCATIAAGANCSIQIAFVPAATGPRLATLQINDNAPNNPHSVALSGSGVGPFMLQLASGASSTATVANGNLATYQISVAPNPGFAGTVQLACTGAPQNSTCTIQTSTVNLSTGVSTNIVVTVSTGVMSISSTLKKPTILLAFALFMPLIFMSYRSRRSGLAFCVILLAALAGIGCSSGNSAQSSSPVIRTPPGSYTLTVTGSTGASTQTVSLTLIVQ